MKAIQFPLLLSALTLLGSLTAPEAQALLCKGDFFGGRYWNCIWDYPAIFRPIGCAPEVQEANLSATDRVLKELSGSKNFENATRFKELLAQIQEFKSEPQKIGAYFSLVGVRGDQVDEVAQFVGVREGQSTERYLSALMQNAELNREQAEAVAQAVRAALRGNLE